MTTQIRTTPTDRFVYRRVAGPLRISAILTARGRGLSWGAGQWVSPAVPAAVHRAAPAPTDPPHAPQPLPVPRTTFDAVLHAERPTPLLCLRQHISSPPALPLPIVWTDHLPEHPAPLHSFRKWDGQGGRLSPAPHHLLAAKQPAIHSNTELAELVAVVNTIVNDLITRK